MEVSVMHDWLDTMAFGPTHWLIFVAMVAIIFYPAGRILKRIGFSPFWSVLVFVPLVNLIAMWVFAMVDWPEQKRR